MKIFAFEEITYPGLPRNLGPEMRITNRYCDPQLVVQHYREHLEELARAEDYGFDGIFVNEHHFTASNNNPDCNLTAAILIDRTKNCHIGVIGNIIALRHPLAVAEEFAMLDCLSGGRFIPGMVRGLPAEWVSYNMDPFTARKRFAEAYHIIHQALTQELVDYEGDFWNIAHASIWPRPVQNPFPPFWMPAGSLESIRFAAENRLVACQTLQPTIVLKQCFDEYRRIAAEEFGWNPGFNNFAGLRFMHLGEDHRKAVEEGVEMFSYLMLSIGRPVLNPAPLPGFNTDQSYKHRRANADDVFSSTAARHNLKSSEADQATKFKDAGLMLSGNPETVAEWLVEDAKAAGYGNLIVTFRVGNGTHKQALKSQELFAKYVMPILRNVNVEETGKVNEGFAAIPLEVRSASSNGLPFYQDSNYTLSPDVVEMVGVARNAENGRVTLAWEMQVARIAEDGNPTQIIVPGPAPEHKGCAIQLRLVTKDGAEIADDATVVLEASGPDNADKQMMFEGHYKQFAEAPDHTVAAQMRGVARNDYSIRLSISIPSTAAEPDLEHEESTFQIKCFKHLLTLSA
ncbi:MAG: LLM class flavin-dependent oxidoreductase [Deltaproteobacteria bacterium]|nr:LLM class flavin-dependent oxidoreductase [Deltaproteobacteria bacterium]